MRQFLPRTLVGLVLAMSVVLAPTASAQPQARRDVADLLPHNTTACLRLADVQRVYAAMEQTEAKDTIIAAILREDPGLS